MTDLVERFGRIPTSTICDACARSRLRRPEQVFLAGLTPRTGRRHRVAGRARTQRFELVGDPARSSLVADRPLSFRLVEEAQPGDFLVVTTSGGPPYAVFGGALGLVARRRGAVGVVVDGQTCDVGELDELGLAVWAAGVSPIPAGHGGYSVAEVDTPVVARGVEVRPGDVIVGDGDGVVVVPLSVAEELIEVCEAMDLDERAAHEALAAGRAMADVYPSRAYYRTEPGELL